MNGAVRSASVAMSPGITAAYNRTQFPVIADIGGGIGTQLAPILDASPASRGILFDKPHLRTDQQEALQKLQIPQQIAFKYLAQRAPEHSCEISQTLRKLATWM